jgi:hypothetical protein
MVQPKNPVKYPSVAGEWRIAGTRPAILHFKQMILTTTKIRQIILNLPDFFLSFLDKPVILCVTDHSDGTPKKTSGGWQGKKDPPSGGPFIP